MVNFIPKKTSAFKTNPVDATYLRNFSLAVLNWERNRQETRFAFSTFDEGNATRLAFKAKR